MKFEINVMTTITGFFTVEAGSLEEVQANLNNGEYDDLIQDVADSPDDIDTTTRIENKMTTMSNYLVRDATNCNAIYGIVRLGSEEYWKKALNYVIDCRNNGRDNESDSELIEEYFQMNNIEYEWIDFDKELML